MGDLGEQMRSSLERMGFGPSRGREGRLFGFVAPSYARAV